MPAKTSGIGRYRAFLTYLGREWRYLLVIASLTVLGAVVTAIQPWPLKLLVDHALGGAGVPPLLAAPLSRVRPDGVVAALMVVAAAGSVLVFVVTSVLNYGIASAWTVAGQRMVFALAADVFQRLQRLSLQFHVARSVADSLGRLMVDTYAIYTASESLIVGPLRHGLVLGTIGTLAWSLDHELTFLSFAIAPGLAASAMFFGNRLERRTRLNREAQSGVLSFVHQTLSALPIVQAFDATSRNRVTYDRLGREAVARSQRTVLLNTSLSLVNGAIITAGTGLVLYKGAVRVFDNTLLLGTLLVFLAYLVSLQHAFEELFSIFTISRTMRANLDRVLEILDADEMVQERPGAPSLPPVTGAIRFEAVTFGYDRDRPILHDLTLAIEPGQTVALVGATGAGKSTLASLVPRFCDPWQGRVLLDGHDVRDVTLASLRGQIALVLQEPFLLPISVADNIAYGRPDATRADIEAAARAANAEGFIQQLPQGYDTVLAERGVTLSGGERQRLSIARALLKNAPLLILDEPTSALDAQTEALLLEALERLMAGRTTLIIAHRLSTIRRADVIVVLAHGRIVELGHHDDLLARRGSYARLHAMSMHPAVVGDAS